MLPRWDDQRGGAGADIVRPCRRTARIEVEVDGELAEPGDFASVAGIAQAVVEVVPGAKLLITGESGPDPRSYRVDFSAFRKACGFDTAWSIPDGAAELYKEYISAGLTADAFKNKFTRLPHLEALRVEGILDVSMRRAMTGV